MELLITVAAWATVIANAMAAIFIALQAQKMAEGLRQGRMQNQHTLCLEIWREYNSAFSDRQWLLENPVRLNEITEKYATADAIFNSEEYKKLRRVATVYGMAESLIQSGAIDKGIIFQYISVPPKLWEDHREFVEYVRKHFYPHLFVGWETLNESGSHLWKVERPSVVTAPLVQVREASSADSPPVIQRSTCS